MASECSTDILDHIDINKIADAWSLLNTRNVSMRLIISFFMLSEADLASLLI